MIESSGLKPPKLLAAMVVMDVHLPKNIIKTAGASRRGFVDVLVIRLVTVLVSPIHCFCGEFAFLALLRLGIAFRLRLGTVHLGLSLNSTISQGLVCVIISPSSSITSRNNSLVLTCFGLRLKSSQWFDVVLALGWNLVLALAIALSWDLLVKGSFEA